MWCSLLAHLHSRLRFDQNQSLETREWMYNALLWAHSDFQFCYKLELLLSKINLYILLLGRPCNAFFYFSVHCLHSKPIYLTRIGPQTHPQIDFVPLIIHKAPFISGCVHGPGHGQAPISQHHHHCQTSPVFCTPGYFGTPATVAPPGYA